MKNRNIQETKPDRYVRNEKFIDGVKNSWVKLFSFLTYAGSRKQRIYEEFDKKYGRENWLTAHFFDGEVVSRYQGYKEYDEAYYEFLKNNPNVRNWIVNTASEFIDFAESNIDSGLDLTKQESRATHLQDISVRRALTRLLLEEKGVEYDIENLPKIPIFKGDHIVQIRGHKTEGFVLNPGQVPFHKPELIVGEYDRRDWWKKGSAEDAYQRNNILLVNPEGLELYLAMISDTSIYFSEDRRTYFRTHPDDCSSLFYKNGKEARRSYEKRKELIEVKDSPLKKYSQWVRLMPEIKARNNGKRRMDFGELK